MATLALAVAGAAAGSALLPAGVTILGATISGATIGAQVGALAGSYIDQTLLGAAGARTPKGPRLSELRITGSSQGTAVPRLYGRARLGGQLIWATDFEEEVATVSQSGGGGKGGVPAPKTKGTEYRYYASFAVALCEGEIAGIGRVWADGTELDLATVTFRVHAGTEMQAPDSLIEAHEGTGEAPAYRGTAYVVFERLALADFGNRIPQLSFEVHRPVDDFPARIRAVTLIPGAGEFAYALKPVIRKPGAATNVAENVHTRQGGDGGSTDWAVALDQLQAMLPGVAAVNLIVGWFGTDLRAGHCQIRPGVDAADKFTTPLVWRVASLGRGQAHLVSQADGRAAYGGTPSDETVIAAIQDLKARGLAVTLTPFLFMDIPAGNVLPDPYAGGGSQPAYPWRGRITVSPAPGETGTPDKTAAAATQVAAFVGTAAVSDFTAGDEAVVYAGPAEWSYRRFVLHYAHLAKAAGGVDAFVIGSEMRGLTTVRDGASTYPFVAALATLATDVKSVLGTSTGLTYAADWSEYFGHQPADGSGDVHFHLDPLWAASAIDAVGIDCYWPIADWRDGTAHADAVAGARSVYDLGYLKANLVGGEGFDWHYAIPADREAQIRTPIADGVAGKPWVFRFKDLRSWWLNQHYDRPGGLESATPTAWVPQSKPFWLMELGCPAVDRGANQPNVFVDPKSSESHLPHFSHGRRDDLMQRRYLEAFHAAFDPDHPGYLAGLNPVSSVYADRMLDLARLHVYCWDARPHPAFPADAAAWGDGANWRLGHWLTGRMASAPLAETVAAILADHGFADYDVGGLDGLLGGLVVDRILSARDTLQPLELAFFLDTRESGGRIVLAHRSAAPLAAELTQDDLVETRAEAALATLTRAQETDLPAAVKLTYIGADADYPVAVEEARRLAGRSGRVALADLPLVLDAEQAAGIAEVWLHETWAARERAQFALPPSHLALEPGDALSLAASGRTHLLRIVEVGEHGGRDIEALSLDPGIYANAPAAIRPRTGSVDVIAGQPLVTFLDLPLLRGDEPPAAGYLAAAQSPWPGPIAVYRSPDAAGFQLHAIAPAPAVTGVTLDPLPTGATSRLDRATSVRVKLDSGALASVTGLALLGGANAAAVRNDDGEWEVLQFLSAVLTAPATYNLSGFLRGQAGTEHAMRAPLAAGARFVLLDAALARLDLSDDELGLAFNWRCGPASRDFGSPTYVQHAHAFRGEGGKPLSPVHVRATRTGGDLHLAWIRRTRLSGDSWDTIEVPLAEAEERYEIDILDGATVKRTLTATAPTAIYSAAQQTVDFGAPQPSIALRLYQLSATRGRGTAREAMA